MCANMKQECVFAALMAGAAGAHASPFSLDARTSVGEAVKESPSGSDPNPPGPQTLPLARHKDLGHRRPPSFRVVSTFKRKNRRCWFHPRWINQSGFTGFWAASEVFGVVFGSWIKE